MYDGGYGGPGFDWNGNGRRDHVDGYMDYNVANSKGSGKSNNKKNKSSWDLIGVMWIAVVIVFVALYLVLFVLENSPLICIAICFGVPILVITFIIVS